MDSNLLSLVFVILVRIEGNLIEQEILGPRVSDAPVPATKPRKIPLATTRRRLRWKKFQTRQSTSRQMGQHLCKMTSKPTRYAL